MRRKNILTCMIFLLVLFVFPNNSEAITKKMTTYNYIIKDSNILYCCGFGGIYRADLKRKKLKWIVKIKGNPIGNQYHSMKKQGSYIFFRRDNKLYRVHIPSGKVKKIAGTKDLFIDEYVVEGSKIYYYQEDQKYSHNSQFYRSGYYEMNLDGDENKRSEVQIDVTDEDTNVGKKYRLSWRVKRIGKNKWRDVEYVEKDGKKLFHIIKVFYWSPPKGTIFL